MVKIAKFTQLHDVDNKEQGIHIVGYCLSTDQKPLEFANGSILIETDHEDGAKVYMYDEPHRRWDLQNKG